MLKIALVLIVTFSANFAFAQDKNTGNAALSAGISKVLSNDKMKKTKVGVYAIDVESGDVLIDIDAKKAFNPASNAKIVTSAAALEKFGPSKVWATRISAGAFKKGEVKTLYIKSDGDPMLLFEDLVTWAVFLKQKGVKKVTGGIVIDVSSFPDSLPPGFDQQKEDASYRPDVSSFSVNYNMASVLIDPTTKGKTAMLTVRPPNTHVEVVGSVKTVAGRASKLTSKAEKTPKGTKITINGTIGEKALRGVVRKRIDSPSIFAGDVFREALKTVGIEVDGGIRKGTRPKDAVTLHFHLSQPLWYAIAMMNKYSNNFIAEQLFMLLGSQKNGAATVVGARESIASFMKKAKVDTKGFTAFNGSGLYVGNEVSPFQLVSILRYMYAQNTYPEFANSLAVAGGGGTLRTRLRKEKGNARGKTGTLSKVTALSGYAKTKSGRTIAYSVLLNDPPIHAARMRTLQDNIVEAIIKFSK